MEINNSDLPVICKRCTKWQKASERSKTKGGNVSMICNECMDKKKQELKKENLNFRSYKKIIPLRFQANYKKNLL